MVTRPRIISFGFYRGILSIIELSMQSVSISFVYPFIGDFEAVIGGDFAFAVNHPLPGGSLRNRDLNRMGNIVRVSDYSESEWWSRGLCGVRLLIRESSLVLYLRVIIRVG